MFSSNVGGFSAKRAKRPRHSTAEAMAIYCDQTFPLIGRRNAVAREWDLRDDEARSVIEGKASKATLDRIYQHDNGGWRVVIPVLGIVTGQALDQHITREQERVANERRSYEEREERLADMAGHLRAMGRLSLSGPDRMAG